MGCSSVTNYNEIASCVFWRMCCSVAFGALTWFESEVAGWIYCNEKRPRSRSS